VSFPPQAYAAQPYSQHPQNLYGGRSYFEEIPDDRGWLFEDAPIFQAIRDSFRRSYWRSEYLLWSLSPPGNVVLGEDPASGFDARQPFPAVDSITGLVIGNANSPVLDDVNVNNNNGFRGTFGLPIGPGTAELSGFILHTSDVKQDLTHLITPGDLAGPPIVLPTFIAQTVTVDGLPSDSQLLYTDGYQYRLKTSMWGSEANYVLNYNEGRGDIIAISPLFGARYLNLNESLDQRGTYQFSDDGGLTSRPVERRIFSRTSNNSYGMQFGVRGEFKTKRLTIGAEPKLMIGVNSYKANLNTANILSDAEPVVSLRDSKTTWGPIADLNVYTRFAMTENLHVTAGYNFMWIGRITRPYNNIDYNTSIITGNGEFNQRVNMTDAVLQGLTFGVEYQF
jgi:hypothetical protein